VKAEKYIPNGRDDLLFISALDMGRCCGQNRKT
jgi:hypothetical protein